MNTGQRMSLKGKLFDLQKNLKLLEVEEQMNNEMDCTFQPNLEANYRLPFREKNFNDSVKRADMIRKQKLDMLKQTLNQEEKDSCTFSPAINKKSKKLSLGNGNVGNRLYYQAVKSRNKVEEQSAAMREINPTSGQKLFSPYMYTTGVRAGDTVSTASAASTLYDEAVWRETRRQQKVNEIVHAEGALANIPKMNKQSLKLFRSKILREVKGIYEHLETIKGTGEIYFENIKEMLHSLIKKGKYKENRLYELSERVWSVFDCDKSGRVPQEKFQFVCIAILERGTPAGEWAKPGASSSKVSNSILLDDGQTHESQLESSPIRKSVTSRPSASIPEPANTSMDSNYDGEEDVDSVALSMNDLTMDGNAGVAVAAAAAELDNKTENFIQPSHQRRKEHWMSCLSQLPAKQIGVTRDFLQNIVSVFKIGRELRTVENVREWTRQKEDQQIKGYFKPSINKNASKLAQNRITRERKMLDQLKRDVGEDGVDSQTAAILKAVAAEQKGKKDAALSPYMSTRLTLFMDRRQKKQEKLKKELYDAEMKPCTFHPNLKNLPDSNMSRLHKRKLISDTFDALVNLQQSNATIARDLKKNAEFKTQAQSPSAPVHKEKENVDKEQEEGDVGVKNNRTVNPTSNIKSPLRKNDKEKKGVIDVTTLGTSIDVLRKAVLSYLNKIPTHTNTDSSSNGNAITVSQQQAQLNSPALSAHTPTNPKTGAISSGMYPRLKKDAHRLFDCLEHVETMFTINHATAAVSPDKLFCDDSVSDTMSQVTTSVASASINMGMYLQSPKGVTPGNSAHRGRGGKNPQSPSHRGRFIDRFHFVQTLYAQMQEEEDDFQMDDDDDYNINNDGMMGDVEAESVGVVGDQENETAADDIICDVVDSNGITALRHSSSPEKMLDNVARACAESIVTALQRWHVTEEAERLTVHERLYAKSKAPVRKGLVKVDKDAIDDMNECTFKPSVNQRTTKMKKLHMPGAVGDVRQIKGAENYFKRLQKAREKEEKDEDIFAFSEERYQKSRKLAAAGPKEFQWATDARKKVKEKTRKYEGAAALCL